MPSAGTVVAGLVALIVIAVLAIGGFMWWQSRSAQHVAVKAQQQAGAAVVAAGQAQAESAAQRIVVAGEARDRVDLTIHQENAHAIAAAPGADAPLDPRFVDALDNGLCGYAAQSADPGCHPLPAADPAELPPADSGGAAAADAGDGR